MMRTEHKISFFQEQIIKWYELNGRNFYWRNKDLNNYQYIIAEVLLQRTKAEKIANFYPAFIKEFPNWESLANTSIEYLENYLTPIGLYRQRSIRLQKLAIEMIKRKEILPTNRKELESIPFMGQYTANAVELIIFNRQTPLIDVNMARVIERLFGRRKTVDIRYDKYLQDLSSKIVAHSKAKEINWAVLDFAALMCKTKLPECINCPFNIICKYFLKRSK